MERRIYDDPRMFWGCSEDVPGILSRYFQDVLVSFVGLVSQVGGLVETVVVLVAKMCVKQ